jgi:hypothetical protein
VGSNLGGDVEVAAGGQEIITLATPIDNPDAAYLAATTKIDFSGLPDGTVVDAITDGVLTVSFSESLAKTGPVPDGWATWSSPPFSEDPNPFVLIASTNVLEMVLSRPVSIFGFEMEPSPFAPIEFTVEFFRGNTLVETITRVVDGDAGARLFARENGAIDRVLITAESDFAIAQVRYQLAPPIQALIILLVLILILLLALILL